MSKSKRDWIKATGLLRAASLMPYNGLQLQEVGDFGAQNFQLALNLNRGTKLHLTTEMPISCRCCWQ